MSALRILLFGRFQVGWNEQVLAGLDARKAQELFCYLLLYRDRPHYRETLASLLWDDCSIAQAKRYLRKALWQLQAALEPQTTSIINPVLLVEPDWVQLNPDAACWLDVAVLEEAFTRVQGVQGKALDPQCVQILKSAVSLHRGGLLDGWYQDWCLYERERFQHMYLAMLDKLMGYCEAHGEYDTGLVYGMRILRYDRARERTHRRLMRLHYLAGHRTAALRQYERCVEALSEELGVRPARRTVALYQYIQEDRLDGPIPTPAGSHPAPEAAPSSLPEILSRLKQLQTILADAQHHVEQDIQAVELAANGQH